MTEEEKQNKLLRVMVAMVLHHTGGPIKTLTVQPDILAEADKLLADSAHSLRMRRAPDGCVVLSIEPLILDDDDITIG